MSEENKAQRAGRIVGRLALPLLRKLFELVVVIVLVAAAMDYQDRQDRRELQRAKAMITALGSVQNFIDYEKVNK